tara:strand:+ start:1485 stop:2489 length:1005 start_codon:yes stop_codon:yes gene_type:complete
MANLFEKAANIAMEKVRPSPKISIMIAMEGGGGLSDVKRTMNIGGQPHKLAYITPDEGTLLKQLGGSGRKVNGVPAYDFTDEGDYEIGQALGEAGHDPGYGPDDPGGDEPPEVTFGGDQKGQPNEGLTSISYSPATKGSKIGEYTLDLITPPGFNLISKATTGKTVGEHTFGSKGGSWSSPEAVGPDGRSLGDKDSKGFEEEEDEGGEEEEEEKVGTKKEEKRKMTMVEKYLRNMIERQQEGGDPLYNIYETDILKRIYPKKEFDARRRMMALEDYGLSLLEDEADEDQDTDTDTDTDIEKILSQTDDIGLTENELRILREIYGEDFDDEREVA